MKEIKKFMDVAGVDEFKELVEHLEKHNRLPGLAGVLKELICLIS